MVRALIGEAGRGLSSTPGFRTMSLCVYTPRALIYQGQTRINVVSISSSDGSMLWHKKNRRTTPTRAMSTATCCRASANEAAR